MINTILTLDQHISLVEKIRTVMKDRKIGLEDLARKTGYSKRSIYYLLDVNHPISRDCMYEVTRYLEIRMEDIT